MELGENEKNIILIAMAVMLAGVALFLISQEMEISQEEFEERLVAADGIGIVMDLRGAPPAGRDRIMGCGVELAGSSGLVGKEMSIYSFDGEECITRESILKEEIRTIEECEMEMRGLFLFHIYYGDNNSTLFKNRAEIKINESYEGGCTVERA